MHDLSPPQEVILNQDQRAKEYFFIIDNTEWPEALSDASWTKPEVIPAGGSKDVYLKLYTKTTYQSNGKYIFWTFMFTLILGCLGFLFLVAGACYIRQTYRYNVYSKDRKAIKLEILKIKDTEYT